VKKLSVITATGGRPEALDICKRLMIRQTLPKEDWEWIVVDDVIEKKESVALGLPDARYIFPERKWKPGENSHKSNISLGLEAANGEWLAFVEDDDWYHPDFLRAYLAFAEQRQSLAVGELHARYYNLQSRRYKKMGNYEHASLCQTVVHRSLIPLVKRAIALATPFWDMPMWSEIRASVPFSFFPESVYSVGIKGLPGRTGIGIGHSPPTDWAIDYSLQELKSLVGDDFELYSRFIGEPK
jgi:glycosyltransferase involved in cell wall biosynthesis